MELHKYDVIEAEIKYRSGSVQGKKRPYVIVSNEIGTRNASIVTIVPLTTVIKGLHLPVHGCIEACTENGLAKYSMILGEQPQTIGKSEVIRKIGNVKDQNQRNVINKVVYFFFLFWRRYRLGGNLGMSNYRDMINRSRGNGIIYCIHDENTCIHEDKTFISQAEALDILDGADVHTYMEDDGIGTIIFYKGNSDIVHSMLMSLG